MLISEKNQYLKSGYHPDSTSKPIFMFRKSQKVTKSLKKANLSRIWGKVENAILGKYLYNSHFHYSQIFSYLDGRANAYTNVSRLGLGAELWKKLARKNSKLLKSGTHSRGATVSTGLFKGATRKQGSRRQGGAVLNSRTNNQQTIWRPADLAQWDETFQVELANRSSFDLS